jgi:hypothetical protein
MQARKRKIHLERRINVLRGLSMGLKARTGHVGNSREIVPKQIVHQRHNEIVDVIRNRGLKLINAVLMAMNYPF